MGKCRQECTFPGQAPGMPGENGREGSRFVVGICGKCDETEAGKSERVDGSRSRLMAGSKAQDEDRGVSERVRYDALRLF